jgi:cytochrome P450
VSLLGGAAWITSSGAPSRASHFAKSAVRQDWKDIAPRRAAIATTPLDTTVVDIIDGLCDRFTEDIHGGPVPVDATRTYPVAAVCAALGVPVGQWPLFARWAADFLDPAALDQLYSHVDVMIADRCAHPGGDLLTELIRLDVDGEGLTVDDLRTIVAVLVAGAEIG